MADRGDPPEGPSENSASGSEDEYRSLVFDESFVRAARLQEFSAQERMGEHARAVRSLPGRAVRNGSRAALALVVLIALAFGTAVFMGFRHPYQNPVTRRAEPLRMTVVPLAPRGVVPMRHHSRPLREQPRRPVPEGGRRHQPSGDPADGELLRQPGVRSAGHGQGLPGGLLARSRRPGRERRAPRGVTARPGPDESVRAEHERPARRRAARGVRLAGAVRSGRGHPRSGDPGPRHAAIRRGGGRRPGGGVGPHLRLCTPPSRLGPSTGGRCLAVHRTAGDALPVRPGRSAAAPAGGADQLCPGRTTVLLRRHHRGPAAAARGQTGGRRRPGGHRPVCDEAGPPRRCAGRWRSAPCRPGLRVLGPRGLLRAVRSVVSGRPGPLGACAARAGELVAELAAQVMRLRPLCRRPASSAGPCCCAPSRRSARRTP